VFERFKRELSAHLAKGYHVVKPAVGTWAGDFQCASYSRFLAEIGGGSFFAGSLILFAPGHDDQAKQAADTDLVAAGIDEGFACGYDGTTSGFYYLSRSGGCAVYWMEWGATESTVVAADFGTWIERTPDTHFDAEIYRAFRPVRFPDEVARVVSERMKFEVQLVNFSPELVRPPGKQNDLLPRYHPVNLRVTKRHTSPLTQLTALMYREGSEVGLDNVQAVTVEVGSMPPGESRTLQAYVFDPFNLPFIAMRCLFTLAIDLSNPNRVRFEEIRKYL